MAMNDSGCTSCGIGAASCEIPSGSGESSGGGGSDRLGRGDRMGRRGGSDTSGSTRISRPSGPSGPQGQTMQTQQPAPAQPRVAPMPPEPARAAQPPPPAPTPVVVTQQSTPQATPQTQVVQTAQPSQSGKDLVPGSPEYCARFPETELCRQGVAAPAKQPASTRMVYCGDPGAHPELCTERPQGSAPVKSAGMVGGDVESCIQDFLNMTPERQIQTIQASGPIGRYATAAESQAGIYAGREGAAESFASLVRSMRAGSPEVTAFCAAVRGMVAPAGRSEYMANPAGHSAYFGVRPSGMPDNTGYFIGSSATPEQWDARYSVPSAMMPSGSVSGCIAPPGYAPSGAVTGDPVGERDDFLALFLALPAQAQAAVLLSPAFGQGASLDSYAHFLANQLLGGAVSFNDVSIADLAVSHIKNYAPRASMPEVRALIDRMIVQEATSWGIVAPTEFAPSGNAAAPTAANPGDPPPGFTAAQWLALINSNPEVAARLRTEHQQRPSTFQQVSGTIMQAANVALTAVQQNAAARLSQQQADQAHQQAMARIQIDREAAAARNLLAQQGVVPGTGMDATTLATMAMQAQQNAQNATLAAAQQGANTANVAATSNTGTIVAVGALVAVGGGVAFAMSRGGSKSRTRENGASWWPFGGKKAAKKSARKGR